jgi:hypothetical protein
LIKKESAIATHWNCDKSNKFLFLTGKPQKPHRIRLLYKLQQQNLLNRATWSFFMDQYHYHRSRRLVNELSDLEFHRFVSAYENNPDKIELVTDQGRFHYGGIPYQIELYQNSLFQIISETLFGKASTWLTEKTWLAIVNRRPFLMAGPDKALARLKNIGFRTFENYLLIQYDDIENTEQKLDAIVTNARHWVDNIHLYTDGIAQDIEHNYQLMIALAQKQVEKLQQLILYHALDCEIEEVVKFADTSDYKLPYQILDYSNEPLPPTNDELFVAWYNDIKDPAWPICKVENDFNKLPEWIQNECIEVFGYKKL